MMLKATTIEKLELADSVSHQEIFRHLVSPSVVIPNRSCKVFCSDPQITAGRDCSLLDEVYSCKIIPETISLSCKIGMKGSPYIQNYNSTDFSSYCRILI
jgi:hypothetical protein